VGIEGVGAECVDADAFMGVIAIPEGLSWGGVVFVSLFSNSWITRMSG